MAFSFHEKILLSGEQRRRLGASLALQWRKRVTVTASAAPGCTGVRRRILRLSEGVVPISEGDPRISGGVLWISRLVLRDQLDLKAGKRLAKSLSPVVPSFSDFRKARELDAKGTERQGKGAAREAKAAGRLPKIP
jgi:hypothetical protein